MEQSDYLQLIHKYLNGELSPEEILVFEKELETSKELRDALRVEKALLQGIEAAGDERNIPVILRADAETPHHFVVTAMDVTAQLGFSRLSLATEQITEE